jgi:hypothetical protein
MVDKDYGRRPNQGVTRRIGRGYDQRGLARLVGASQSNRLTTDVIPLDHRTREVLVCEKSPSGGDWVGLVLVREVARK